MLCHIRCVLSVVLGRLKRRSALKLLKEALGYDGDLQAAYDYYKAYSSATAGRFLSAYEKAVETLRYSPLFAERAVTVGAR